VVDVVAVADERERDAAQVAADDLGRGEQVGQRLARDARGSSAR
jgi:hypothetical protein